MDGAVVPALGECMEGIDVCYPEKVSGQHPLVVSLANTGEPCSSSTTVGTGRRTG